MEKITFNHYKNAIQEHYEIKKNDDVTGILLNPTPAQLRTYCSLTVDKGLTPQDEEIFRKFFETKSNESLKKSIDNCNINNFKTIISFLKNRRDSEMSLRVELSAILVDFNPRPYNKYYNFSGQVKNDEIDVISNPAAESGKEDEGKKIQVDLLNQEKNNIKRNLKRKTSIVIIGLIGLSSIGFTVKNTLFKNKECMQWQNDHYEYVDCDKKGLLELYPIVPVDKSLISLRKIEVNKETPFFCNGQPNIWYCKHNNKVEFYNSHGIHPETGKPLKAITNYMINEYVKK